MKDIPVILFPHSSLTELSARKILSFFGPVTLFQPWYMDRPGFFAENPAPTCIRVLNPPASLDPGKAFPSLLAEYHDWIRHHGDRSYTEIIKATHKETLTENTTWEIRRMVHRAGLQDERPESNQSVKWHLVLHFARELEDHRFEADRLLQSLRDKQSPLKELVEEESELSDVLQDLPAFEAEPLTGEHRLDQIMEAWFSLFGVYLREHELLVTLNRHVMNHVSQIWQELSTEDSGLSSPLLSLKTPDLSSVPFDRLPEFKETHFHAGKIEELAEVLRSLGGTPLLHAESLSLLAREAEDSFPRELSQSALTVTVRYLTPVPQDHGRAENRVLRHLSGKTLILLA